MNMVLYFFVMAAAMLALSHVLPGFHLYGWGLSRNPTIDALPPALIAAFILAILNVILRPILWVLTLPFIIVTLGLFLFIINAVVLWVTSLLVPGFRIDGLFPALLASLILSVVSMIWKSATREVKD